MINDMTQNHPPKKPHYYSRARSEMLPFLPSKIGTMLDIGCGEAEFARLVKTQFQANVWGIERETAVAQKAARQLDKVLVGDVTTILPTLPANYFDCVVFNDILEHLERPEVVLAMSQRLLTPNGVIVCSIPNVRNFHTMVDVVIRKQWHYVDEGVMDRTHLRFFTEKSIRNMFHACNYDIVLMQGINAVKNPWAWLIAWLSLGYHADICYRQFACQAKPREE